MPERKRATCEVRLYNVGHQHGAAPAVVSSRGFGWWDNLEETHEQGQSTKNAQGQTYLQYIEKLGLVCRAFSTPQSTLLADYDTTGGVWSQRRPDASRQYYLVQSDASPDLSWSATSKAGKTLPHQPQFAVSFVPFDTATDHDLDAKPPYFEIELGVQGDTGQWKVRVSRDAGTQLLYRLNGVWEAVKDLPQPQPHPTRPTDERQIWFQPARNKIVISTDWGTRHTTYELPRRVSPVTDIRRGGIIFRGQGGAAVIGLHQLRYYEGTYLSVTRDTAQVRSAAVVTLTGRADGPGGSGIALTDAGIPLQRIARYRAAFNLGSQGGWPFRMYWTPLLYTVNYQIAATSVATGGTYTTPWTKILSVDLYKPPDPAGATCSFQFATDAFTELDLAALRGRLVQVRVGWLYDDDSITWTTGFTGIIRHPTAEWAEGEFAEVKVTVQLDNLSVRFREGAEWTPFDVIPLGGSTPNAIGDYILGTEGLSADYRNWDAIGAVFPLTPGLAEDPCELIRPGEEKWETLRRVFGYYGLEVGVDDDGILFSRPRHYVEDAVTWHFRATPHDATDIREQFAAAQNGVDWSRMYTAVVVTGKDHETGEELFVFAVDPSAESSLVSGRFNPWRRVWQEAVPGTTTRGLLVGRCQELANDLFRVPWEPDFTVPVDHDLYQGQRIAVWGCAGVSIPDGTEHAVIALKHTYSWGPEDSLCTLRTSAGLRRLD